MRSTESWRPRCDGDIRGRACAGSARWTNHFGARFAASGVFLLLCDACKERQEEKFRGMFAFDRYLPLVVPDPRDHDMALAIELFIHMLRRYPEALEEARRTWR